MNFKYHAKRVLYLAALATHLRKSGQYARVEWSTLRGDPLKPILLLAPSKPSTVWFTIPIAGMNTPLYLEPSVASPHPFCLAKVVPRVEHHSVFCCGEIADEKEKGAPSEFVIRVVPCISDDVFPLPKLGPLRSNVRSATPPGFKWEGDDGDFTAEWRVGGSILIKYCFRV